MLQNGLGGRNRKPLCLVSGVHSIHPLIGRHHVLRQHWVVVIKAYVSTHGPTLERHAAVCNVLSPSVTADLFEERQEVGHDVERRPDAIYLYGVDVMSTGMTYAILTNPVGLESQSLILPASSRAVQTLLWPTTLPRSSSSSLMQSL
jgi:hypothetical protein